MSDLKNILVVDDELSMRQFLKILLKSAGYNVITAKNGEKALEELANNKFSVILMDYNMPEAIDGLDLLNEFKKRSPNTQIVIITAYASTDQAIKAVELGAVDYVSKPFNVAEIKSIVKKSIEEYEKVAQTPNIATKTEPKKISEPIFASKTMEEIFEHAKKIANTDATVLITGESGVGKEIVAEFIHNNSPRKNAQLFPLNCGAIPENLQESELFGYEKGAFTGAYQQKKGYFEVANNGTLFLDEIGELGINAQVKLLRVIQEKRFSRVGGTETITTNARLITATNRNLKEEISKGKFREDLFFRINVFEIYIPPLRERKEDILPLAQHFLQIFNKKYKKTVEIDEKFKNFLMNYEFKGNVRELKNIIEKGCLLTTTNTITPQILTTRQTEQKPEETIKLPVQLDEIIEKIEKKYVEQALKETNWNRQKAAKMLGITNRSIRYRIDKLGIKENE